MQSFSTKTIREIALEMPETVRVFEQHKIDYCCGGRRPFVEACESAGVDPSLLSEELASALSTASAFDNDRPEKQTPGNLIDYIISTHHVFTKNEIERLSALMQKVCSKHGQQHEELFGLRAIFNGMAEEMLLHMRKEENVLFPYIKQLDSAAQAGKPILAPPFGTVRNPIRMMRSEHDGAAEQFREMRDVTKNYALPEDACPSFRGLYFGLQELEKDLHRHVHLENNVLFDQAEILESAVFQGA